MNKYSVLISFLLIINFSLNAFEKICSERDCYVVVEKLGQGAFGTVYSVKDSHGDQFALKSYHEVNSDGIFNDSVREFERGQIFDHKNIIKSVDVFSAFEENGSLTSNVILELVKGKTLHQVSAIDSETALHALSDFIDSLKYVSTLGFMHLDLHSGNVMLADSHQIYLIDLASFVTLKEYLDFFEKLAAGNPEGVKAILTAQDILYFYYISICILSEQIIERADIDAQVRDELLEEINRYIDYLRELRDNGQEISFEEFFNKFESICQPVLS